MKNNLKINIPENNIIFKPNNSDELWAKDKCEFKVELINLSNEFASFEIELYPKDLTIKPDFKWYSVEPEICSKIQPGDCTDFYIRILKAPIHAYNRTIELEIKAFSVEHEYLFDTKIINLEIKDPDDYFNIELPIKNITSYPGEIVDIPWIIYNFSKNPKDVDLIIKLTNPFQSGKNYSAWINNEENFRIVSVAGGQNKKDKFQINIPSDASNAVEGLYIFSIEARYDEGQNFCSDEGTLNILPYGTVKFECPKPVQSIPSKKLGRNIAQYELLFTNQSNVKQTIIPEVLVAGNQEIEWCNKNEVVKSLEEIPLKEPSSTYIKVRRKQHIFGRERRFVLQVIADVLYANNGQASEKIQALPNSQVLQLKVKPVIPFWLQITLLLGLLSSLIYFLLHLPKPPKPEVKADGHINSVRFLKNNNKDIVVSGSSNQTISLWENKENKNGSERIQQQRLIFRRGKPIRVIRERPENNDQIVVALDTGELERWQIQPTSEQLGGKPFAKPGRAFALDFSDQDTLFSGHAGAVYQWQWKNKNFINDIPTKKELKVDFVVSAISVIKEKKLLAVAGQFNQLLLWDWENNYIYKINYFDDITKENLKIKPVFGKNDYINSAAFNNNILATADNQGFITLWNIDKDKITSCIKYLGSKLNNDDKNNQANNQANNPSCQNPPIIKQWIASDNHESIRSIQITEDAQNLVSVGEDGKIKLWCNISQGTKIERPPSYKIDSFNTRLRSVSITNQTQNKNEILIATDAPNNQVKIHEVNKNDCK